MEKEESGINEQIGDSREIKVERKEMRSSCNEDDSVVTNLSAGNVEQTLNLLRGESSDVLDYFWKLKDYNDKHSQTIAGLLGSREETKHRIRRLASTCRFSSTSSSLDYHEYSRTSRISSDFEQSTHDRLDSLSSTRNTNSSTEETIENTVFEE